MINEELDFYFGKDSVGDTPEERAKTSKIRFVRSVIQLSEKISENQTGLELSMEQVYNNFGLEIIEEVYWYGSAFLISDIDPSIIIQQQRIKLGLLVEQLSEKTGFTVEQIQNYEDPNNKDLKMVQLAKICSILGLDPITIGFNKEKEKK